MDLYKEMLLHGATESQLKSKTMQMMIDILASGKDIDLPTISKRIEELKNQFNGVGYELLNAQKRATNTLIDAKNIVESADETLKKIEAAQTIAGKDAIKNDETMDAVNAYAAVLRATVKELGAENMTETVMGKAIEAGSYIAWRGIMGLKSNKATYKEVY